MDIVEYLHAYYKPLWDMLSNITVPGFNINFLTFFLGVLMINAVCSFINHVIQLNITTDIRSSIASRNDSHTEVYNSKGELIRSIYRVKNK